MGAITIVNIEIKLHIESTVRIKMVIELIFGSVKIKL